MSNEQKKDIDSEIGMGNYLLKQVYQLGVTFGGIFGGAYAGVLATLPFFKNTQPNDLVKLHKIPGLKHASANQMQWGGGIGAFLGMMMSGIVLGYGHWKKIRQSQMQVDEITKNISDIEVFKKADPELKAENERLWNELHARDKGRDVAPMASADLSAKPTKTIEKSDMQLHGKAAPLASEIAV